jgi:all-trans-retinol dehydrogenase (NAD+)
MAESLYLELRNRESSVSTTLVCPYFVNTGLLDGVESNAPRLVPILQEQWAVDRIVLAVQRREEQPCMPALIGLAVVAKVLPVPWQLAISNRLGINDGMNDFKDKNK